MNTFKPPKDTLKYIMDKYKLDDQVVPVEIRNINRLELVRWIRELDFKLGVEIGVANAEFSKIICRDNPQLKLYGVDPWVIYSDYTDYGTQPQLDSAKEEALSRMKTFRWTAIQKTSMEALKDFDDNSLDFVYIDGNHSYKYALEDISGWHKKVKPGGIVAGHDYIRIANYGVKEAVQKFTRDNGISPWFIMGAHNRVVGELRDRQRSWFYVK